MSLLCEAMWKTGHALPLPERCSWEGGWKQHQLALVFGKAHVGMACASFPLKQRLQCNPWTDHIQQYHASGQFVGPWLRVPGQRPIPFRTRQPIKATQGDSINAPEDESTSKDALDYPAPMGLSTPVSPGSTSTSQEHRHRRGLGTRLRRHVNKRAANILHTFRKEEKMKVEYANEEEELAALTEQRYKLASGLKRTLLRIGICFVVLAVIKILNSLREALLVTPVDYFKLIGVLSSLDYWALAFLVFDIRNTIMEIEKNDVEGDPTVRVLEQENVAIGISFEKFFKRMFKVLSAIAFAQVLGALSVTGFQFAPNVDNGLRQLWSFVSPHL